jgi:SanA protein
MLKKYKKVIFILSLALIIIVLGSNLLVENSSSGLIYSDKGKLSQHKVGLVLGCSKLLSDGRTNLFFKYRIQAAVDLYKAGRVEYLIVSGDNSVVTYDEPSDMKAELISMGIPADKVYCDYAGFRTLDSVIRVSKVFCENKFVVISQEFHAERAVCIGRAKGLDVVGFNAREVGVLSSFKTKAREYLARTKMVLDLYFFNAQPKFLGPKILIPSTPS